MENNHQDIRSDNGVPGVPPVKRAPVLAQSTIIGAGLGCAAGVGYMIVATNPDGSGVKGSEWLLFAIVGCVLGVVVGIIRGLLREED